MLFLFFQICFQKGRGKCGGGGLLWGGFFLFYSVVVVSICSMYKKGTVHVFIMLIPTEFFNSVIVFHCYKENNNTVETFCYETLLRIQDKYMNGT